jgi:hypothetical protein
MPAAKVASMRWQRVTRTAQDYGISRGFLYGLAAKHKGLFRKVDNVTFVDTPMLDRIIAQSPPADLPMTELAVREGDDGAAP